MTSAWHFTRNFSNTTTGVTYGHQGKLAQDTLNGNDVKDRLFVVKLVHTTRNPKDSNHPTRKQSDIIEIMAIICIIAIMHIIAIICIIRIIAIFRIIKYFQG